MAGYIKVIKSKNLHTTLLYPARISFIIDGKIKSFTDKQKLRELSTINCRTNTKRAFIVRKDERRKKPINTIKTMPIGTYIYMNSYFKCKCIKCSKQKTQKG